MIRYNKDQCCGCGACELVCPVNAITMSYDQEGFLYPIIDSCKCINCGQCDRICPELSDNNLNVNSALNGYAVKNSNREVLLSSSSGGLFFEFAKEFLENGGIVVGASFYNHCEQVKHILIHDIKDIHLLMGSKYVQSDITDCLPRIKELLERGTPILFSGVLCQIQALKNYLKKDYCSLLCVDIICHGVPSPGLWRDYVQHLSNSKGKKLAYVNFRYKTHHKIRNEKGIYIIKNIEPFMNLFTMNLTLRPSCYCCKFKGLNRNADVTIGDFWGSNEFLTNIDSRDGISVLIIHSEKGEILFDKCKDEFVYEKIDCKKVFRNHNQELLTSAKKPECRDVFFTDYCKMDIKKLFKKWTNFPPQFLIKQILDRIGIRKAKEEGVYIEYSNSN